MQKIRLHVFVYKYLLFVKGTTWSYIDLELPDLEGLGPFIESITPHTLTEGRTTNMEWKIVFYWSIDGRTWSGPVDLFSAVTTDGNAIQTDYTTKTALGIKMRYALAGRSSSADTEEKATITALGAFSYQT